jgi:mRNA interferase RelE/StbE
LGCERPRAFAVEYHPNALKDLSKLDKPVARRIVNAVDALKVNPRPNGAGPLAGYPELWRIRVGNYRVVYTIRDAELIILALRVRHRSNVYRGR